jgi:arylsulfatase
VLSPGEHTITVEFAYDGGFGQGGHAALIVDDAIVASARVDKTVPLVFSMSGETFDIGIDTGAPVGPYPHQFPCTARIIGVTLTRLDRPSEATRAAMREGEFRASISTQ